MREDVKWNPHPRCAKPHALWSAPDKDAWPSLTYHVPAA